MRSKAIIALLMLLFAAACRQPNNEGSLVIANVNIIPMTSDTVFSNQTVIVIDGKISAIGSSNEIEIPANATIIEADGRYLIPGLSDMHVHFYKDFALDLFIANGVTTVRSMLGTHYHLKLRDSINSGAMLGPEIFTTGPLLDAGNQNMYRSIPVDNPEAAIKAVIKCKEDGFDYIKVYQGVPLESYKAIISKARELDIKVVGHLPDSVSIGLALSSQQYSMEHAHQYLKGMDKDTLITLNDLANSDTWFCPTLSVSAKYNQLQNVDQLLQDSNLKYIDKETVSWWKHKLYKEESKRDLKFLQEQTGKLSDLGGKILLGTDCFNAFVLYGFSVHDELGLLVESGLSPYEALRTSTHNAAQCLETIKRSGTIEVGKDSDMLLLNGNPLKDISKTRTIEGVMVKGRWFNKADLEQLLVKNIH